MILAVRSVPLSLETRDAWKTANIQFRMRNTNNVWLPHMNGRFEAVLNLGNVDHVFDDVPVPVFNPPSIIKAISTPKALRRTIGDFVPSISRLDPHWHKTPGFGGEGKRLCGDWWCDTNDDTQQHVYGQEYRIITVGSRIVQASKKHRSTLGPFEFDYEWVGVQGISNNHIIPTLKQALKLIPDSDLSVFGWDIIVNENELWVLEINTSPGVNEPTALRVTDAIKRSI